VLAALTCVPGTNPVVLAGDSHNAWASEIYKADGSRAAVEFAGPAVTGERCFSLELSTREIQNQPTSGQRHQPTVAHRSRLAYESQLLARSR
jgi:phosphodiesterase/alkaline phosphatase D-like protein